jgi:hypothetical protein
MTGYQKMLLFLSVTVYNTNLSSQYNLSAQIEQVHDNYTIYVHFRKIIKLFERAVETGRKVSLWRAFLSCFAASENRKTKKTLNNCD